MSDLIDRQAAIETVMECYDNDELFEVYEDKLRELPPAQPEIIRCKDCNHRWTHKCMDSMPIERCDLGQTFYDAEVDYCSLAERREVTT